MSIKGVRKAEQTLFAVPVTTLHKGEEVKVKEGWTHDQLIEKARVWLRSKGCSVVISELVTRETPDALGFDGSHSILIECKTSRSDFRADQNKTWRRLPEMGLGVERYYLAPKGLLSHNEIPGKWGLLEVYENGRIRKTKEAECYMADRKAEISLLISALRRIGQHAPEGISVKCYTVKTVDKAVIEFVESENEPANYWEGH